MERKLVKQGKNALTVTLPYEWLKKNNLKNKDVVQIQEEKDYLKIESSIKREKKGISLDITNLEKGLAFHKVTGVYIEGYDKISIKHNNFSLAQDIGKSFLGMIVEKNEDKLLILSNLIAVPVNNFIEVFNRSAQLLISLSRDLRKIKNNRISFEEIKIQERLLDSHIIYCLRYINKYENVENSNKYFLLVANIENVGDNIVMMAKNLLNQKNLNANQIKICEIIIEMIEKYVYYLLQNNLDEIFKLLNNLKEEFNGESFIDGIANSIRENLYNYIGYLIVKDSM